MAGDGQGFLRPDMIVKDTLLRPLTSLRISVTDRCNLRCAYCMPEENYVWLPREEILHFGEMAALVDVFLSLGVRKVRLTGGEPLLRKDLPRFVRMLAEKPAIEDLAMTTNGVRLAEEAGALFAAGLRRVTVSLDTLRPERFERLARSNQHSRVLEGIEAARAAGFRGTKLNCVVMRGFNDDELCDLVEYAGKNDAEIRFIEYMDVGGATNWSMDKVVARDEILANLAERYGTLRPLRTDPHAPAERFALPDGRTFGVIASTTRPFCRACDRARITADGMFYLCLYARKGIDLKTPFRAGATAGEIARRIQEAWAARTDRGAEERLGLRRRGPLAGAAELKADPHLEMHKRGG